MTENDNDLNLDQIQNEAQTEVNKKLEVKDRFAKLSEKMATSEKGRLDAEAKVKAESDSRAQAEKERDFFRGFSQISAKYPQAAEFQDQILERVNKGYDVEDAAITVLAKEGKFGGSPQPIVSATQSKGVAGGSSATAITEMGERDPNHMSQEDRRNTLLQMEKEGTNLFGRI